MPDAKTPSADLDARVRKDFMALLGKAAWGIAALLVMYLCGWAWATNATLAVHEQKFVDQQRQQDKIEASLQRIEGKLDQRTPKP